MIGVFAAFGGVLAAVLFGVRLLIGPTLSDRALAANALVVSVLLILASLGVGSGDDRFLDAALGLGVALFVLNAAVFKIARMGTLQPPLSRPARRGEA